MFPKYKGFFSTRACWECFVLTVSVSADVRESAVLVSVLLWFLWERHDQRLGAHPLQPGLYFSSSHHLRHPGPGQIRRNSDEAARALQGCTDLQGDSAASERERNKTLI